MTIFKTYLKVLNKCKVPILLYTICLIAFGGFNMQTSEKNMGFTPSKPDVLIINEGENVGITKNLIQYLQKNVHVVKIKDDKNAINDALFYRDVNYIIYIPSSFRKDFLEGKKPEIKIKKTGDYQSSLAEILLGRYLEVAETYQKIYPVEDTLLLKIEEALKTKSKIEIKTKLDTDGLAKSTFYYNFLSYSMMAGAIYVICLILSSFHEEKVRKRTIVSSIDIKKQNRILLFANLLFAFVLWCIYVILSFILCGKIMYSIWGPFYLLNSFVFSFVCVTLAILISHLIYNKNAINGIVNVIALGSSFLCGTFVPVTFLPDSVLKVAHVLPTYWYVHTNELLKGIEKFTFSTMKPIFIDIIILFMFSLLFILLSNLVSKKRQRSN